MTKIVLDCYGGDNAPEEIVKGALDALDNDSDLSLVLTGKEDVLKRLSREIPTASKSSTHKTSLRTTTYPPTQSAKKPKAVW